MRQNTWAINSALFGMPYEMGNFAADIQRLGRMVRGQLEPRPREEDVRVWASAEHLERLVDTGQPLAVDIETTPGDKTRPWTGKDPTQAHMKTIGFGTTTQGISIYWPDADATTTSLVGQVLASPQVLKVFHNGPWFDIRVLRRYGMSIENFRDTRAMRRCLSSTSKLSLRHLASIYTDFWNWKDADEDDEDVKMWDSSDLEKLMLYNAYDCIVTARVYRGILQDWRDE